MIHSIESRFNLIASYEDAALDWKAANAKSYWAKVFHLEMDLGDVLVPVSSLIHNNVEDEVE
jgi:hypothetical protein